MSSVELFPTKGPIESGIVFPTQDPINNCLLYLKPDLGRL
jgi:hypothetical protein